jgi:hypothetical protein
LILDIKVPTAGTHADLATELAKDVPVSTWFGAGRYVWIPVVLTALVGRVVHKKMLRTSVE